MFVPSVGRGAQLVPPESSSSSSFAMGQTAFVVESQFAAVSGDIMTREGGQEQLESRLVRPQLQQGDALIFDTRILHFGLANQSRASGGGSDSGGKGSSHSSGYGDGDGDFSSISSSFSVSSG